MDTALVIFDGDCSFCTSSVRWLERLLSGRRRARAAVVPWQNCDLAAYRVDPQRVRAEVVWVGPDGHQSGGADAIADWFAWQPGPLRTLGRLQRWPVIRPTSQAIYRLVARNRHRLPGGTPACRLDRS